MKTIIFDWKRTLYNPDTKTLIIGALDLLLFLKQKNIACILIGKGNHKMYEEVERLGIRKYFTQVIFCEGKKDISLFESFIDKRKPEETIIIGDRINSEIVIGNQLGATTIWVKQGKFAGEEPEDRTQIPSYTVSSIAEVKALWKNKLKKG